MYEDYAGAELMGSTDKALCGRL